MWEKLKICSSEAQPEKAACFWKKHERQILKARLLFRKAGGLLGKRRRAFYQKAAAFLVKGRKPLEKRCVPSAVKVIVLRFQGFLTSRFFGIVDKKIQKKTLTLVSVLIIP